MVDGQGRAGTEELESQHSADPLDRASEEADFNVREALRNQGLRAAMENPTPRRDPATGEIITLCIVQDCGEDVEPERLAIGLGLCSGCAHERAARDAHRRKTRAF